MLTSLLRGWRKIRNELKDAVSANITKAQQDQKEYYYYYYDRRHSPEVHTRFTERTYISKINVGSTTLAQKSCSKTLNYQKERKVGNLKTNIRDLM